MLRTSQWTHNQPAGSDRLHSHGTTPHVKKYHKVVSSWGWAQGGPKHVEQLIRRNKYNTKWHLIGFLFHIELWCTFNHKSNSVIDLIFWLFNSKPILLLLYVQPVSAEQSYGIWLIFCNEKCEFKSALYRVGESLVAPNYCLYIQSNSAGFSFINTGKQVHLKHARWHFERNLVKDMQCRSVASRNWLKS